MTGREGVTQRVLATRMHKLWHYFSWLLLCGALWGTGSAAHALSAVRLDDGVGDGVLVGKFGAFVDSGAQLTLADVQSPTNANRFAVPQAKRNGVPSRQRRLSACAHCIAGVSALPTAKQVESSTARKLK